MRPADAAECVAGGFQPREALLNSIAMSEVCVAVEFGGQLGAIFGVVTLGGSLLGLPKGNVWMLTTHVIDAHRVSFYRASRSMILELGKTYSFLCNFVDVRHVQAIRWLKALGFKLHPPAPYGPNGALFCFFER